MIITCPSGLQFEARPWTLGDQNHLTDTETVEAGQLPMKMVEVVCVRLVEPGPYSFTTKVDFGQVTLSDITAANIQIRMRSDKDSKFPFDTPCQHCGLMQHVEVDLAEVDVFACSDEGIEHVHVGVPLTVELESDKGLAVVHLKLLRGKDLSIVAKWQEKDPGKMLEIQACLSIEKIILAGNNDSVMGMPKIRAFWQRQSWGFGGTVRDALDEAEGGADVIYKHRCDPIKGCGKEQEGVLPLGPEFYGLQRSQTRRRGRKLFSADGSTEKDTPELSTTS